MDEHTFWGLIRSAEGNLVRMRAGSQPPPGASGANIRTFQGPESFMSPFTQVPKRKLVFLLSYNPDSQRPVNSILLIFLYIGNPYDLKYFSFKRESIEN